MIQLSKKQLAARMGLSRDQFNNAIKLFDQQLWCWGEDVKRPNGNLLVACGFERIPPPKGQEQFGSMYSRRIRRGGRIVLRGWGLLISDRKHGAILLKRYGFTPELLSGEEIPTQLWDTSDLPKLISPQSDVDVSRVLFLLSAACRWVVSYETWLRLRIGMKHRETSIEHWKKMKKTNFSCDEVDRLWRLLAKRLEEAAIRLEKSVLARAA
ncbi:MAG: hypothetical protein FJ302_05665 [Planctomycetes bacterium]|nr:hypothetical protein [Planctomycetota bacterium]